MTTASPAANPSTRPNPHEDKILLLLTLIIGAIVGLVVVAFILLTENLGARLYPAHGAPWRRLVMPILGSLGAGALLARYFPNARGSGIPQTKIALFIRDGFIAFKTVVGKFGLSAVTMASGVALGREGPSVQVGAGIASVLGRKLGLSRASVKALLPVGASAALAAAFNTPIAAVLFSLEEVMGDMHAPVLGSVVLSSATSWMVLHLILGDEPLFHVPSYQLVHPLEFGIYAVLGVAGGFVSVAFVKLLLWLRKGFQSMPKSTLWWQPACGGVLVGVLGWFFPGVLGVGYGYVGQALNGEMLVRGMALLVLLKLVATATCYASGNAGGIFGPSLFIGAMMGGAIGGVAHSWLPDYTGSVGAYALVGMGAAFAGIIRVPLTSVIMIFEITRDYSIIVPLMIANLISYFISARFQPEAVYEALQHQDGIHLPGGHHVQQAFLTVAQAMRNPKPLSVDLPVAGLGWDADAWPVVDPNGLRGILTTDQLARALQEGRDSGTVGDLVPPPDPRRLDAPSFPHLHADHPLDFAMRRMAETGLRMLPVVGRTNVRELEGVVTVDGILAAYASGGVPIESPQAEMRRPLALLVGVLAVLIVVASVGGFLNYRYRIERSGRAQHYYEQGNALLAKDQYDAAIEKYRNALSVTHKPEYRLALALALVKAGHPNEAAIYLTEFLDTDPHSAPANLGMARVDVSQSRLDDAVGYYHRAIYGTWPDNPLQRRTDARLELVQVLGDAGRRQQAQGELLSMLASLPGGLGVKKQVAAVLLQYSLDKEAAALYRDVTERDPLDEEAFAGLGEAEFALSNYAAARDALETAARLNPNDTAASRRLGACNQILALDPGQRGLGAQQRFERSRQVLSGVVEALGTCPAPALHDPMESARKLLRGTQRPPSFADAALKNTALSEELWSVGSKGCPALPPPDAPLSRVMARLMAH